MSRSIRASALLVALLVSLGFRVSQASASIVLSFGDANYVGLINDGVPSNPADEARYINNLITLGAGQGDTVIANPPPPPGTSETYNRVSSTLSPLGGFPTATDVGADKSNSGNSTVILTTGFKYILGKYDATSAGSLVWYSATGFSGSVTLPSSYNGHGISHISVYNPTNGGGGGIEEVPEPVSLAVWALLSVVAIGAVIVRQSSRVCWIR